MEENFEDEKGVEEKIELERRRLRVPQTNDCKPQTRGKEPSGTRGTDISSRGRNECYSERLMAYPEARRRVPEEGHGNWGEGKRVPEEFQKKDSCWCEADHCKTHGQI